MASSCCTVYTSHTYDSMCLLTLTPANGKSVTVNLFGATVYDVFDIDGNVVGYCISGLNSFAKVSNSSSISKATVAGHILTCHGG